jgi:Flp pilus assembly protein TadD
VPGGRFRRSEAGGATNKIIAVDDLFELFKRGTELLEAGHHHQATIPLTRARELAPDKASIREALGRALFGARRYREAGAEFEAVIDRATTNDFALFCLGRSLQMMGRHAEARKPLTLAANLQPSRRDYRIYRDRARRHASTDAERGASETSETGGAGRL